MDESKSKGKGLSIAMILIAIVLGFGIVIGLTQTTGANNMKENESEISKYVFSEDGALLAYTGDKTEIEIPTTYSLSANTETVEMSSSSVTALVERARNYGIKKYTIENQTGNFQDDYGNYYYQEKYVLTYQKRLVIEGNDYQVTSIGSEAFRNNTRITKVTLPETITSIKNNAFSGCYNLRTINFPENLELIEYSAFFNCNRLQDFTFPDNVRYIGAQAFQDCDTLTNVVLPTSLTELQSMAFMDCNNLERVVIKGNVRYINSQAFQNCRKLVDLTIEEGVQNISNNAFYGCRALTEVTIPSSVYFIANQAFYQCTNLHIINIVGCNMVDIEYNAFPTQVLRIYVDDSMYETYLNYGNWPNYSSKLDRISNKV